MNSVAIAGVVFACAFGGSMVGLWLQSVLPETHLRDESKTAINLGAGLIATMAALVLGLMIGTATSDFAETENEFEQMATNIVLLDRTLKHYGPEAQPARQQLQKVVGDAIDRLELPVDSQAGAAVARGLTADGGALLDSIRNLAPRDDGQRSLQGHALDIVTELARTRWLMVQGNSGSIPLPFLVVLAFWLMVLFTSFGLFSPRNATVVAVFFVCALSVAGAVFLIVDMDQPFDGLVQISSASLQNAKSQLGK